MTRKLLDPIRRRMYSEYAYVLRAKVEELQRLVLGLLQPLVALRFGGHEDPLPLGLDPAAVDLVVAIPLLRLAAIDHVVVEQVVVARTLPDLRVHDDRAIQSDHLIGRRRARLHIELVVAGDHVAPPGLADVALQFHAHGAVVPQTVQAAVNLAGGKQKSAPLAQGHQLVHLHDCSPLLQIGRQRVAANFLV